MTVDSIFSNAELIASYYLTTTSHVKFNDPHLQNTLFALNYQILCGGATLMPGFAHRLLQEVQMLLIFAVFVSMYLCKHICSEKVPRNFRNVTLRSISNFTELLWRAFGIVSTCLNPRSPRTCTALLEVAYISTPTTRLLLRIRQLMWRVRNQYDTLHRNISLAGWVACAYG